MMAATFCTLLLQLTAFAAAAPFEYFSDDPVNGIVQFDVQHNIEPFSLLKRRGLADTTIPLTNAISYYTIDFKVGSPPQKVSAVLDTGSSDLWLYDKVSGHIPYFDANSSSTYQYVNDHLFISYGSGPVMGNWARDTIEFSKFPLENATLGLVTRDRLTGSKIPGILGVGKILNEATDSIYANVPALLMQEGIIRKNVYSIALNELNSSRGSCIFGGLDKSKYKGPLYLLPMTKDAHISVRLSGISFVNSTNYATPLVMPLPIHASSNDTLSTSTASASVSTSVSVATSTATSSTGTTNVPPASSDGTLDKSSAAQALLDTGTSFMYLPDATVDQIVDRLGAVYYPQYGVFFVPTINDSTPSLSFNFSGANIVVPVSEYITQASLFTPDLTPTPYILTVFKSSLVRGYVILGDTFMRSAYVVFDLTDNQIAIAQADHSTPTISLSPTISSSSSATSTFLTAASSTGSTYTVSVSAVSGTSTTPSITVSKTTPSPTILQIISSIPGAIPAPNLKA